MCSCVIQYRTDDCTVILMEKQQKNDYSVRSAHTVALLGPFLHFHAANLFDLKGGKNSDHRRHKGNEPFTTTHELNRASQKRFTSLKV